MEACTKHQQLPSTPMDFTIDLTSPEYSKLQTQGNFVFVTKEIDILIAYTINGEYIALAARCTHQGSLLAYYPSDKIFCSRHGALFATDGTVLQGPANAPLRKFSTSLNGNSLRVYG